LNQFGSRSEKTCSFTAGSSSLELMGVGIPRADDTLRPRENAAARAVADPSAMQSSADVDFG
jgi:hypothetical protein